MIKHIVVFQLKDGINPAKRNSFFKALERMKTIPGVKNYYFLFLSADTQNYIIQPESLNGRKLL